MKAFPFLVFMGAAAIALAAEPDVQEIVSRSTAAMERNWNAAPGFTYVEHDSDTKRDGKRVVRTFRVYMIEGSQYNELIAINDQPLDATQQDREAAKLKAEIERRRNESPSERTQRVAKYQRERQQDQAMLRLMATAFDFKLTGREQVNGRETWVLDATPKPDFRPSTREGHVLEGMKGRLWVDCEQYQWVKVAAEVIHPVSLYLVAKVGAGTRFDVQWAPVSPNIWLPTHVVTTVKASALGFLNENSSTDDLFEHYRPMPSEAQLLASAH